MNTLFELTALFFGGAAIVVPAIAWLQRVHEDRRRPLRILAGSASASR